jgi:hypothetical protein
MLIDFHAYICYIWMLFYTILVFIAKVVSSEALDFSRARVEWYERHIIKTSASTF